jgi:hypothetical protein
MSWLYSLALVEDLSAEKCLESDVWEPWSVKNIHVAASCKDKTIEPSLLSLYGMMCVRSASATPSVQTTSGGYGASQINWLFPEVSHARIYRWLEKVQASMANAVAYGENMPGWFAKYDPVSCTWRTAQCSLLEEYQLYSGSFPKWGIMLRGVCWELMTLGETMKGNVYGSWPTATVSDTYTDGLKSAQQTDGSRHSVTLSQSVHMPEIYPTPVSSDATVGAIIGKNDKFVHTGSGTLRKINQNGTDGSIGLARAVVLYPTPMAQDMGGSTRSDFSPKLSEVVKGIATTKQIFPTPKKQNANAAGEHGQGGLEIQTFVAKQFPTPVASEAAKACGKDSQNSLTRMAARGELLPTPAAQDSKNSTLPVSLRNRDTIPGHLLREGHQPGAQLNPDWVELLMHWPLGWTRLEPQQIDLNAWMQSYNLNHHITGEWEKGIPRVTTDKTHRTDRLKAIGNGQYPRTMAGAFVLLWCIVNGKNEVA